MRVLLLNERLDYSNAASYAFDLAGALVERDECVEVCTVGGELVPQFRARGIETHVVKWNLLTFRALLGFLREFDPQLVHIQSLRSIAFGQRIARRLAKPYVVTAHSRPGPTAPFLDDPLLCGVIVTNEVTREALVNQLRAPKSRVRVIKRGIDLRRFRPSAEPTWTPESGRLPVIGSIGSLTPGKGHRVLIDAARRVLDAGVEAHFAIVGEGDDEPALRRRVRELDLVRHLTFSSHIPGERRLYDIFDIVAIPVLKTGVGVTAIEAMAMQKPLITSGVGEMLHLVQDGETGLLVPEGNADRLAERIIELLREPSRLGELGRRAREWVEKEFALAPMVDATIDFYTECLGGIEERLRTV